MMNQLGFIEPIDSLCQGAVVRYARIWCTGNLRREIEDGGGFS
jgi:hypothetical protein